MRDGECRRSRVLSARSSRRSALGDLRRGDTLSRELGDDRLGGDCACAGGGSLRSRETRVERLAGYRGEGRGGLGDFSSVAGEAAIASRQDCRIDTTKNETTDLDDAEAAAELALACATLPADAAEAEICVGCTPAEEREAEADFAATDEAERADRVARLDLLCNVSLALRSSIDGDSRRLERSTAVRPNTRSRRKGLVRGTRGRSGSVRTNRRGVTL